MSARTTPAQFRMFEREFRKWVRRFGLLDWRISFLHVPLDHGDMAECEYDLGHRSAHIRLNSRPADDADVSSRFIRRVAFHECVELLLCPCTDMMHESRPRHMVTPETHKIIRVLENLLIGERL